MPTEDKKDEIYLRELVKFTDRLLEIGALQCGMMINLPKENKKIIVEYGNKPIFAKEK